jgi:Ca2+-binding RTX toxin-like protein
VIVNAAGATTVAGGTITSVGDGVATLSDPSNFDSISGNSIVVDFSAFTDEIDEVFGKIGSLLDGIEDLTNLSQSLPLIGGSNLAGQAQVAVGKALGIFEAVDSARAQVIADVGALTTGGFAAVEAAIEGIVGDIKSLGAAVVSRLIATTSDIQGAIDDVLILNTTPFGFDLGVVFTDDPLTTVDINIDVTLQQIINNGGDRLDALVGLINAAIGATDAISGQIFAVLDDAGRLAFQAISSEIKSLVVEADAVTGNLADTLLGYATDATNEIGQRIDDVAAVLTALGDLQYSFSNVDISLNGSDDFVFDFEFDVARQTEFAFDFGDDADANGLSFDAAGKLLVGAGFGFSASVVMDTASNNFTATVSELGAGLEIDDTSGVSVEASIGAVSGTATGPVSLNAGLLAAFTGGATINASSTAASLVTDFALGLSGFDYNFTNDSFTFSGTAGFSANLTLTVGANLIEIGGGAATATITISGGDPFSGDSPTVTFGADFNSFFDFNNLTPTNIINTIANFIGWVEDATGSSLLSDVEIPFVEGGLDDLANLAQILSNALIFDFGGDNVRDAADKLLTDLNSALQAEGLDAFLRAIPGASFGQIDFEFLDGVDSVDISGSSLTGILGNGTGLTSLSLTSLDLTGILSGALTATVTVNLTGGRSVEKQLSISVENMADNVGLGDDLPKLLDGFNTPTFDSVQDFLERLDDIGVLGGSINLSDLSNFYDPGTDQLTYEISITDAPIFDVELPADFELDLGSLLNVQSDTRLVLSGMGSVGLTLGLDITTNPTAGQLPGVSGDLDGTTTLASIGVEPKTQPAVTGTSVPDTIQGVLTADAGISLDVDGTVYDVVVESSDTATNTTITHLVSDINAALTAVFNADSVAAADRVSVSESGGRLVFTGGSGVNNLTIAVASGDPALGAFGLQPTQAASNPGGGATITATGRVPTLIGVFSSDVAFQLTFTDTGPTPTTTYDVTVLATDTLKVVGGEVQNVNRNIIDLVADVQTALGNAAVSGGGAAFDLNNYVEVGFQGRFLVLTLKSTDLSNVAVPFDGFSVVSAVSQLGLPAQTGNTDDLLIRLDNGTAIPVDLSTETTIGGVLAAINGASGPLTAVITPDDAATPENEGGKSLTVSYDSGGVKLASIEATNGSAAASQLGIVGMDVNMFAEPGSPEATPDGSITGRGIGGVTLADRFFIEAPGGGSLENIASFEFDAQAGRLLKDLRLVSDDDVLVSDSTDLRDFVGFDIEIKNVNGFTAGTYKIDSIVTGIDTDDDGTADDFGVKVTLKPSGDADLGTDGLEDGVGIIQTGVLASAALGFIEVDLTGTADFQAEASIGLNTGNAAVSDGTVTLAEVIEALETGVVLDLFRIPSITVPTGDTDFGGVDLTLSIGSGSAGFDAIINDILPGNSASITIDILALGDPFMKTRFDQAGGFTVTDADTFTVNTNATLTGLLIVGAKLRFTLANGDVFDAKMDNVNVDGTITVDLTELTKVQGSDTPALDAAAVDDVILLPSANVMLPDIGAIFEDPFSDFGIDDILNALELLVDFLLELQEFDFLQQPIPVLDKSVADLLGMAQDLADYIDELRANPAGSLQFLEDAINDAIGLSGATLADVFDVVNDNAPGTTADTALSPFEIGWDTAEEMLTLTLNIGAGFSEALNVGFSEMGFGNLFGDIGIDGILDFSGSAGLEASGGIFLTLGVGIDLDQLAAAPTAFDDAIYLLDTSSLEAVLEVAGTSLAFNAGLGPFALSIQNSDTENAEISIGVGAEVKEKNGNAFGTDNRVPIGDIIDGTTPLTSIFEIAGANGASSFGTVMGTLPVFFPNDANLIGTIRIGEEAGSGAPNSGLGDLLNFGNLTFTTDAAALTAAEATLTDGDANNDALVVDISELVTFFTTFDFSSFSLFDNIKLAVDGFDTFLQLLESSVFGALGDLNIPLVGPGFSDAADFIADFRVDFVGPLREVIDAVEDAVDDFTDPDKNIISKLLFDLLGPDGLDLLLELDPGDKPGDLSPGPSPEDFILLDSDALAGVLFDGNDLSTADISWDFKIGQSAAPLDNAGFGFDIGIPGLALRTEAEITAMLGWELELGFGLSTQDGFYLDVENEDGTPELNFSVDVTPSGAITGELGFLALTAQTATRDIDNADGDDNESTGTEQTGLSASFGVDLIDSNTTGESAEDANRLGLTEFGDIGLEFQAAVEAAAVLDLTLGLNSSLVGSAIATGFPSVVADFDFLWGFDTTFSLTESPDFGSVLGDSLQVLALNNVGLDLGEFVTEVLGPIVDAVSEFTAPLQPFIDVLTAPIPVIDAFGINLTMLDLAAALGNFDAGLIENLAEIITLINTVADLRADAGNLNLVIPFGDFVLFDGSGQLDNPFADGFDRSSVFANRVASDAFGDLSSAVDDFLSSNSSDPGTNGKAAKSLQGLNKPGGAFAFPILEDPTQVFGLLMGESPTLVTYDLEPLIVDFELNFFFSIFGPLGVSLGLIIEFAADFAFGYDTLGIQDFVGNDFRNPLQLLNGFFISDTENPDGTGADVPELTFLGGITAAAELNLGIARAGVAGGLFIEIMFDLFDPDSDGKVRINELLSNIENQLRAPGAEKALAPLAIFDVTGEIFARLFAFLKIDLFLFSIDLEFDIVDPITILDFEIDFFRPPVVATETDDGDLIINVGPFAEQRLLGNATDFGETVTVRKKSEGSGEVTVEVFTTSNGFGSDSPTASNAFEHVMDANGTLIIDGGAGDDHIFLDGWKGNEVVFDIRGGLGDDEIKFINSVAGDFNSPFNIIDGGAGADDIIGSNGRDFITGAAGDDTIDAAGGDDFVLGDQADIFQASVVIDPLGNDGADDLTGGTGEDILIGGGGQDKLVGGGGDDLILGDGGQINFTNNLTNENTLFSNVRALHLGGVTGADALGEGVADEIFGDDEAGSETGDDIIFASGGNDWVDAGKGADVVFGGAGFDDIFGGDGPDLLFGDVGSILAAVTPLSNSDALTQVAKKIGLAADGAGDTISGGEDNDLIFAASGNDTVDAGGGDDLVFGGAGADFIEGGAGNDDLRGESQGDIIYGDDVAGSETGNDIINGGTGPDLVFGGLGDDVIISTKGSDIVNAGEGSDTYRVNLAGGTTTSFIDIIDGGTGASEVDRLEVNGTDRADTILIRADASGANAFIAGINGEFNVERVNYGSTLERIIVNGGAGDDLIVSDDTAASIEVNGESGDDTFQVGQLFRTQRNVNSLTMPSIDTGILSEDFFTTIEVTRGWLSNGISHTMTINGGIGNDNFTVYHNKAVLTLNGDEGDDIFEVRAFALVGSQEPQRERTDLSGGAGADLIRYAVNAPVNINGGDGFDTLVVIGTEFGDDFVITKNGVFGAGLNVNFVNIESLRVDGAEGDDRFFVQSTKDTVLTEIFGGLGDDTFNASGDTPPVVSNDFRGHSGIITHEIESSDPLFNGQSLFGISANVGDNDEPFAIITESQGVTIVNEGDAVGDSYQIVLTQQPTKDVFVIINAPLPSPSNREQAAYAFSVSSPTALSTLGDGSSVVLKFTTVNWKTAQTVNVQATTATFNDFPSGSFTRTDVDGGRDGRRCWQ